MEEAKEPQIQIRLRKKKKGEQQSVGRVIGNRARLVKLRLLGLLRLKLALKFDDILRGFLGLRGHAVGVAVTEAPSCQFTF